MAWEKYHYYECEALRNHPSANSWTRMLYRILSRKKLGNIPDEEWETLRHFWGLVGDRHLASNNITATALRAQNLFQTTFTDISVELLFCRVRSIFHFAFPHSKLARLTPLRLS